MDIMSSYYIFHFDVFELIKQNNSMIKKRIKNNMYVASSPEKIGRKINHAVLIPHWRGEKSGHFIRHGGGLHFFPPLQLWY